MEKIKYWATDLETGEIHEISKENHDLIKNFKAARPTLSTIKGHVIIYGTAGDLDGNDYKEFYNSENKFNEKI